MTSWVCDFLSDYIIVWNSLLRIKSSNIFRLLDSVLKGGVGGENAWELDVSCVVENDGIGGTKGLRARGREMKGRYEASSQTD